MDYRVLSEKSTYNSRKLGFLVTRLLVTDGNVRPFRDDFGVMVGIFHSPAGACWLTCELCGLSGVLHHVCALAMNIVEEIRNPLLAFLGFTEESQSFGQVRIDVIVEKVRESDTQLLCISVAESISFTRFGKFTVEP